MNNVYNLLSILCHCLEMIKYKMHKNTPESDEENVLIWRIKVDHNMFRMRNVLTDSMINNINWLLWPILFCGDDFYEIVDVFFKAWH